MFVYLIMYAFKYAIHVIWTFICQPNVISSLYVTFATYNRQSVMRNALEVGCI